MAASPGSSRAPAHLPPHGHPHHPHYQHYDAYPAPGSPPSAMAQSGSSARAPSSYKHPAAEHRHQQQQHQPHPHEYTYGPSAHSHHQQQQQRHAMPNSGYYAPSPAQRAGSIHQSPVLPPQHLAAGPSRHPAPPYPTNEAYAQAPGHPQHHGQPMQPYSHHLPPPHHMAGMGYYEADLLDEAAHARYMASQQHAHVAGAYPPPHPSMGLPHNAYPQHHMAVVHPSQLPPDHPAYQPPPPHHGAGPAPSTKAPAAAPQSQAPSKPAASKSKASGSKSKDTAGKTKEKAAASKGTATKTHTAKEAKAEAAAQVKEAATHSSESKKDKKRREVIDRIHRVHWDTMENREDLFQHLQHRYMSEHTTLLTSPLLSRQYQLNLSMLTLQREATLRQVTLLHAHQVESARKAYEVELAKVEDEAKQARKLIRERLTVAVEDRRKKLKEEKEGGEGGIDTLLDSSSRPHATRKLRNKQSAGTSRRLALAAAAADLDSGDESSVAAGPGTGGGTSAGANGASSSSANAKDRNRDGSLAMANSSNSNPLLVGSRGMDATAPVLGFGGLPELALLESSLRVFDSEGARANGKPSNGSRKGAKGKKRRQQERMQQQQDREHQAETALAEGSLSKRARRKLDRDRLAFIALAASSVPPSLTSGGASGSTSSAGGAGGGLLAGGGVGRAVRWEPGRSVIQLTGAKDYETESDLIRIRGGVGSGKRRRGAAAAAAAAAAAVA
ncbi:unnamed protein product [Parajaminaea phylloscopi]